MGLQICERRLWDTHCILGYSLKNGKALRCRQLSCFCNSCMQDLWRRCSRKSHVKKWEYGTLEPSNNVRDADEVEDFAYERHHDALSDALCIGDNFAIIAPHDNEELADFYVLKCTAQKQKFDTKLKDGWGNVCLAGSFVVKGIWYKQTKGNPYEYKLLQHKPKAILPSHLVRSIKFPMEKVKGCGMKYLISPEAYEAIYNSTPFDV